MEQFGESHFGEYGYFAYITPGGVYFCAES